LNVNGIFYFKNMQQLQNIVLFLPAKFSTAREENSKLVWRVLSSVVANGKYSLRICISRRLNAGENLHKSHTEKLRICRERRSKTTPCAGALALKNT
jgi:hypothetical protein